MKRKVLIGLTVVLTVAFAVLVVVLSREPAQAADPAKDYSKTPKPPTSSQVLSDSYSQPQNPVTQPQPTLVTTPEPASSSSNTPATTPTPVANTQATIPTTTPAVGTTSPTVTKKSNTDPKKPVKKDSSLVNALVQVLNNLQL